MLNQMSSLQQNYESSLIFNKIRGLEMSKISTESKLVVTGEDHLYVVFEGCGPRVCYQRRPGK